MDIFLAVVLLAYLVGVIVLANLIDQRSQTPVKGITQRMLAYPYGADASTLPHAVDEVSDTQAEAQTSLMTLYNLLMAGLLGVLVLSAFGVLLAALVPGVTPADESQISPVTGFVIWMVGTVPAVLGGLVMYSPSFRGWLMARLGGHAGFRASSVVHRTALVLSLVILAYTFINVFQVGGVEGLAEQYEDQPISYLDALLNLFGMVAVALLGVGLLVRRDLRRASERLDLRLPTTDDVVWGTATAFACVVVVFAFVSVLTLFVSPEVLESQSAASDQIARVLTQSLWIAFLAAFSAAVGEEILFRGALQPVFGLIPTTLFFALLHSQYALTPGSVAIIVVGGAFGWLKQRQSTTAAIIAHFAYNFTLLLFGYVAFRLEEMGITPESLESTLFLLRQPWM